MTELSDSIAQIRRMAAVEEAMTPEQRAIVQDRINERYAERRLVEENLDDEIAQATIDRNAAHATYDALVAIRDTPVTGTAALRQAAADNLAALNSPALFTGCQFTNASPTVTRGAGGFTDYLIGRLVMKSGTALPDGTLVLSVASPNSFTMTEDATADATATATVHSMLATKQAELAALQAEDPPPVTDSAELAATQYVAAHVVPIVDIPYK